MAEKKPKYYVVWRGRVPGIYTTWAQCQQQIKGFKKAKHKSFESLIDAQNAFQLFGTKPPPRSSARVLTQIPDYDNAICVDGAYSSNTGIMEYRAVSLPDGVQLFRKSFGTGTNNIAEFLGIVHVLAYCKQSGLTLPIYSDSLTALSWVRNRKARTKLIRTEETASVYDVVARAEKWLKENRYTNPVLKWDTVKKGQIPADFGNK